MPESLGRELLQILRTGIADRAEGLSVSVASNYFPELEVYRHTPGIGDDGDGGGGMLSRLIGLKAALVIRDGQGRKLADFGTPPPVDPVRATALAVTIIVPVAVLAALVWRGLRAR